jgi:hypothetical protein
MTTVTLDDHANLYSDVRQIISCRGAEQIPQAVLAPLCRRVKAVSGVFLRFRKSGGTWRVDAGQTYSISDDSLMRYVEHYHQQDPIAILSNALMERPSERASRVVRLSELTRTQNFRETDYYREFLEPQHIGEIIATFIPLRALGDEFLSIGLHRPTGRSAPLRGQRAVQRGLAGSHRQRVLRSYGDERGYRGRMRDFR